MEVTGGPTIEFVPGRKVCSFMAVVNNIFIMYVPDAKQGMHAYKVSAALIQKLRFSLFFLGYILLVC